MVGRPGQYQFSFNAGELAPAVQGNTGLKQYYAGAAQMLNAEPVPQGGFRLLPRSRYRFTLPRLLDSAGRVALQAFEFGLSRTKTYTVYLTPGLATIAAGGVLVATVPVPYAADDIATLKTVQRFDTMLLFHPTYPIGRLLNNGTDASWTYDTPPFSNVPQVQLTGAYPNIDEKWTIYLSGDTADHLNAALFVVSVNGEETSVIHYATTDISSDIKAAVESLPGVDPGIAVIRQSSGALSGYYEITFSGGNNDGGNFIVSGRVVAPTTASLQTWREQVGKLGGENLFSPTRGYPSCGVFYQDRLAIGGFKAKPTALALSRTGEYFDLNDQLTNVASGALLLNLSTDGAETIVAMTQSKHLVIFTSEADYYVADRAVSAAAAPSIVQSETYGCSPRVPVVSQESGLLYVNRDETILFAATYDAVSDAYVSSPLSLLSSHLIGGMRDAALQRAYTATDSARYWVVRDDGLLVVGLMIRNQDVTAFVRWGTDGAVRAVAVDGSNLVHLAVDRLVGSVMQLCVETLEEDLLLDQAISVTSAIPQTVITGLGMLEGAIVWAVADGYVDGPFRVAAGSITLRNASSHVTVGRWTPPLIETLPLVRDVAAHTVLKRPARVHTVLLDLIASTSLAIGANDRSPRDQSLVPWAVPVDRPPNPFTGQKQVTGLVGWSADGRVTVTQTRPGALQVRNLTVEAKI